MYRLKYHITPKKGLLNDPNGFIEINGEYHLFYQWHPYDTTHGLKYWAHLKSMDLVNWEELPVALEPKDWYDSHGCYSGSAVNDNGIFTLIYTGNVKDEKGNRETYQCLATSEDFINFKKLEINPVMYNQPKGYTRHFRDPKVWEKDGNWFMVMGAQRESNEGAALLFKSKDLKEWNLIGDLADSKLGYMWECPNVFNFEDKDILLFCPQGMDAVGDLYNNIYQTGYFVGKLDYNTGKLEHGDFIEMDRGFEFYAPQVTIDEKGRRLMIGWMGLPDEDEHPTKEYGWIHAMTLPRELELVNDKIYQKPVEEIKLLRKNSVVYNNVSINNEEIELENIYGDAIEISAEFQIEDASEFGMKLRCSENEEEYTNISFTKETSKFSLDRNKSGRGYGGIRSCIVEGSRSTNKLKVNIFVDVSSIEIFINDGEEVFTARIYPDSDSKRIKFYAEGGSVKLDKVEKWDLIG